MPFFRVNAVQRRGKRPAFALCWNILKKKTFRYYIKQIDSMLPCVWFSNRSQKTSKCGKNIIDTLGYASCVTYLFLPHFDVICDLLLNRRTATWNLFVNHSLCINEKRLLRAINKNTIILLPTCLKVYFGKAYSATCVLDEIVQKQTQKQNHCWLQRSIRLSYFDKKKFYNWCCATGSNQESYLTKWNFLTKRVKNNGCFFPQWVVIFF